MYYDELPFLNVDWYSVPMHYFSIYFRYAVDFDDREKAIYSLSLKVIV